MSEDRFNELLRQCKDSPIERKLLRDLYPHLTVDRARELQAQHRIDYFHDMDVTIPDFAFPDIRIAIYCDGYQWHKDYEPFCKDRYQSRELQLRSWIVLRFTGNEINDESEMVLETVQRAITHRKKHWKWRSQQQQERPTKQVRQSQQKPEGGMCGVIVLACVIVGILAALLNFIF